jgi:glycosyltransferase involved in cell wall biosynthesis
MQALRGGVLVKVVVTIPAYNEEKTISSVIQEIFSGVGGAESVEIVVIDDGSTDCTASEAMKAGAHEVVLHKANRGLGIAFRDGLEAALHRGADVIVNIDADGQYNAAEIPALIRPISDGRADIVLGWRDIDNLDHMPKGKKIGNKFATWLTGQLLGLPIKDAQTGFRAFSREAAQRLNLCGKYTYVQETLIQASQKGLLIEQVPIEFRGREGKSRLISNIGSYALKAGSIIFGTYREYHPLRFFLAVGSIAIAIGIVFGTRVLLHFAQTGAVSPYIPSALLSSFLILVGLGAMALGVFIHMLNGHRRLLEEILYREKRRPFERI